MSRVLFRGGVLVDGTGVEPARGDVLVVDGRVAAVGDGIPGADADEVEGGGTDPGLQVVDCSGGFVTPGLFDCHVHFLFEQPTMVQILQTPFSLSFFQAIDRMRRTVATGITYVRDAGGADLGLAEAVRRGLVPGPRMQVAIQMISQTGGHGDDWHVCGAQAGLMAPHPGMPASVVDGPVEMRRKVRELVRAGADVIKVATSGGVLSPRSNPVHGHLRDDEVAELVREADAAGLNVMAHAIAAEGIKTAVRNGVRSIEHGIYLDDEAIELMLEHGTWLVPTLSAPRAVLAQADAGAPMSDAVVAKARLVAAVHDASVQRAVEAGVRVAMGTDCGVGVHGTNLEELEHLAGLGMAPAQVWAAASGVAAELLGVESGHGTLEAGKVGDVVVIDGAHDDLTGLRERVREVWMDGERVHARDTAVSAASP